MKPFEIFRAGKHTPMSGDAVEFAASDLELVVSGYNPDKHHAPIVVGHPKHNHPAFGWIEKLELRGGTLVATPSDVNPDFAELVERKTYRKVSCAFYAPTSPGNPTPGQYALRHVGFLGAMPPAVKGLGAIEFSEEDEVLEFADWTVSSIGSSTARLFRRLRDFLIAEKGIEAADEVIAEWDIESLSRAAVEAEPARPAFSETPAKEPPVTTQTPAAIDPAELERRAAQLTLDETAFAERLAADRRDRDAQTVAAIVAEGRLPKTLAGSALALFGELDDGVLQFGEGDAAVTTTPRAAFEALLKALPKPVVAGELGTAGVEGPDFSDPVEVAGLITTEIADAKAKGETISPATAIQRIKTRTA